MFHAHATQVQTLQNEFKSLKAQLANLKGKSSHQLIMPNLYKVQDRERVFLGRSMASHMMPWLRSMLFLVHTILVSHQNLPFIFALLTLRHKTLMWHQEFFSTRQEIQIDGLASSSSQITKAKGARAVMPQSFHPLKMEERKHLVGEGEEISTP